MTDYPNPLNRDSSLVKVSAAYDTVEADWLHKVVPSHKDIIARATDRIIDAIGLENIKLFLPMNEENGTKAYDLIRRDLTFTYNGPTLAQPGPFGRCPSFDGVNDYLVQDPVTENTVGDTEAILYTGTKRAQKMVAVATKPGFARMKIKRVGTLSSATIRLSIYTDNSGVPGSLATNGQSDTLACSAIGTTWEIRGFTFPTPPPLQKNQQYWLLIEYTDNTGVDASNYIVIAYTTANEYGQPMSYHDGVSWTNSPTANLAFGLWSDDLRLDGDFSIITLIKNNLLDLQYRHIVAGGTMTSVDGIHQRTNADGTYGLAFYDDGQKYVQFRSWPAQFFVLCSTFSKSLAIAKEKGYLNGASIGSLNGTAGAGQAGIVTPICIGARIENVGSGWGLWVGLIGPVIITNTELTAAQVGKVSHELLALRKYGVGV